jgi:hypothetical protein
MDSGRGKEDVSISLAPTPVGAARAPPFPTAGDVHKSDISPALAPAPDPDFGRLPAIAASTSTSTAPHPALAQRHQLIDDALVRAMGCKTLTAKMLADEGPVPLLLFRLLLSLPLQSRLIHAVH